MTLIAYLTGNLCLVEGRGDLKKACLSCEERSKGPEECPLFILFHGLSNLAINTLSFVYYWGTHLDNPKTQENGFKLNFIRVNHTGLLA